MKWHNVTNSPFVADAFCKQTNDGLDTQAFTDSESIRDNQSLDRGWIQSVTIPVQRNVAGTHSRGCVTSRLGQHRPTVHPGDMLQIREAPASNPDHMSNISDRLSLLSSVLSRHKSSSVAADLSSFGVRIS